MKVDEYIRIIKNEGKVKGYVIVDGKRVPLDDNLTKVIDYIGRNTKGLRCIIDKERHARNYPDISDIVSLYKHNGDRLSRLFGKVDIEKIYEIIDTTRKKEIDTYKRAKKRIEEIDEKKLSAGVQKKLKRMPNSKVNRKKSSKLKRIALRGFMVGSLILFLYNNGQKNKNEMIHNDDVSVTLVKDNDNNVSDKVKFNYDEEVKNDSSKMSYSGDEIKDDIAKMNYDNNEVEDKTDDSKDKDNNLEFKCEVSYVGDKEDLKAASKYASLFKIYGKRYGVDEKILMAIAAQESSGIHKAESENGYAKGLMGIENVWKNETLRVYNFDTQEFEETRVDYDKVGSDVEYCIEIGAKIFQNYLNATIRNNHGLVPDNEIVAYSIQKYNYGPGNMSKLFEFNNDWKNNRLLIDTGDCEYSEHVLAKLGDEILTVKGYDSEAEKPVTYTNKISIEVVAKNQKNRL